MNLYKELGFDSDLDTWELMKEMAKDKAKEQENIVKKEKRILDGYKNDIKDFNRMIREEKAKRRRLKMCSYSKGKKETVDWIRNNVAVGSECLDVGACDGIWEDMIGDYLKMDAVEAFEPNIVNHRLRDRYRMVYLCDVKNFEYEHYDLVIFGDVIEHMTVEDASKVLAYAESHADVVVVAVPFRFKQGEIYGNPYERHIQDDLTDSIFKERYKGFEPLFIYTDYGYYFKKTKS